MEMFINKNVIIKCCLGGIDGCGDYYRGFVTSVDDEYICLDDKVYIVKKFVLSITLK